MGNNHMGIGVQMTEPLYISPRLNTDQSNDLYYPQNLPSIVVSLVLNALPGETILDMCASPGGKTTHIASLMNNTVSIIIIIPCNTCQCIYYTCNYRAVL